MELSRRCKSYWGLSESATPFGNRIESEEGLFTWTEFDETVEQIVDGINRRNFILLVGSPCSSKTTAWNAACRAMNESRAWTCCSPRCLDVSRLSETNVYHSVKEAILPDNGRPETKLRRDREAKARQVRQLLEGENSAGRPVCLAVNDAHDCGASFLVLLKRMWDDLYGFDRLLSIALIGHPALLKITASITEIIERATIIRMPGLGEAIPAYIQHELARCGCTEDPFDDSALAELAKLCPPSRRASDAWSTRRDHPLIVNNIVGHALHLAWSAKLRTISATTIVQAIADSKQG